jgi:fluoride exporter
LRILLLIVLGAAGTLARYGLQGLVQNRTGPDFPSGTLLVNLLGSFLVGLVGQYSLNHLSIPPEWRIGITIGFLGAFTTFSSVSWETVRMLEGGEWLNVVVYVTASFLGGILAAMLGMRLGNIL